MPLFKPWLAAEIFKGSKFTSYSDIWALGILFWEFFTRCERPYAFLSFQNIAEFINENYRLQQPSTCPNSVFELMIRMWNTEKNFRPTAHEVHESIRAMKKDMEKFGNDPSTLNEKIPQKVEFMKQKVFIKNVEISSNDDKTNEDDYKNAIECLPWPWFFTKFMIP